MSSQSKNPISKSPKPIGRRNKTSRKEVPLGIRQAIVSSEGIRSSTKEAERWPGVSSSAVRNIRRRAHKRAERTRSGRLRGKPLADISNCVTAPGRGNHKKLTKVIVDQIVEKVTRDSVEPCKPPIVHIEEMGIDIKERTFLKALGERGYVRRLPDDGTDLGGGGESI